MANFKYFNGDAALSGVHERDGKLVGYVSKSDLTGLEQKWIFSPY